MACPGLTSKAPSGATRVLPCGGPGHEGNSSAAFPGRAGGNQSHSRIEPHDPPLWHPMLVYNLGDDNKCSNQTWPLWLCFLGSPGRRGCVLPKKEHGRLCPHAFASVSICENAGRVTTTQSPRQLLSLGQRGTLRLETLESQCVESPRRRQEPVRALHPRRGTAAEGRGRCSPSRACASCLRAAPPWALRSLSPQHICSCRGVSNCSLAPAGTLSTTSRSLAKNIISGEKTRIYVQGMPNYPKLEY